MRALQERSRRGGGEAGERSWHLGQELLYQGKNRVFEYEAAEGFWNLCSG